MAQAQDLTGQRFTNLLITGQDTSRSWGRSRFFYLCDCGKTGSTYAYNLKSGSSTSCGCLTRGTIGARRRQHGGRVGYKKSPTYQSWTAMKQRINNPKNKRFKHYGGRGVTYCERWESFSNFLADMGARPEGLTLERIRTEEGYSPTNCIWADGYVQANNHRGQNKYLVDGELMTQAQLQRHWGISAHHTRKRVVEMTPHTEKEAL